MWNTYLVFRKFLYSVLKNISGNIKFTLEGFWNNPIVFFGSNVIYGAKYTRQYSIDYSVSGQEYNINVNYNEGSLSENPAYDTGFVANAPKGTVFSYTAKSNFVTYLIYYNAYNRAGGQCDVQISVNNVVKTNLMAMAQTGWDLINVQQFNQGGAFYAIEASFFDNVLCNVGDVIRVTLVNGSMCDIQIKFYDAIENANIPVDINAFIFEDSKINL